MARRWTALFLMTLSLAYPLAVGQDASTDAEADGDPYIVICPIEDMIDDGIAVLVERAVKNHYDAEAIVFIIDTPGGRVDSMIKISEQIIDTPVRSIAYIEGMGAISAGAFISFSCDDVIMEPATNIGAAAPVIMGPEGTQPLGEKETSYVRSKMMAVAEHNGHNRDIAVAMVDKDVELYAIPLDDGTFEVYATNTNLSVEDTREAHGKPSEDGALDEWFEDMPDYMAPLKEVIEEAIQDATPREPGEGGDLPEGEVEDPFVGERILSSGKLLTLTTQEAIAYRVIPTSVDNLDQALGYYDLADFRRVELQMTWSEELFRWLTSPLVSMLLLMCGIGGLYFEVRTPGFGLPGIIGLICLGLYFGSRYVIGLSEWIDLALILAGVGLIALEVFVLPGFGIAGIAGGICLIVGIYLSFTFTDFQIPRYSWEFDRIEEGLFVVAGAIILTGLASIVLWRFLPKTPLYGRLVLVGNQDIEAGFTVQTEAEESAVIGMEGVALSPLRPAGRGRFAGKTLNVVTLGDFIEPGIPIVVVQAEGNRYVVDKVKETN